MKKIAQDDGTLSVKLILSNHLKDGSSLTTLLLSLIHFIKPQKNCKNYKDYISLDLGNIPNDFCHAPTIVQCQIMMNI